MAGQNRPKQSCQHNHLCCRSRQYSRCRYRWFDRPEIEQGATEYRYGRAIYDHSRIPGQSVQTDGHGCCHTGQYRLRKLHVSTAGNALPLCQRPRRGSDYGRWASILRRWRMDRFTDCRNPSRRSGPAPEKAIAQRRAGADNARLRDASGQLLGHKGRSGRGENP